MLNYDYKAWKKEEKGLWTAYTFFSLTLVNFLGLKSKKNSTDTSFI